MELNLSDQNASTSSVGDLLSSLGREELSLHNNWDAWEWSTSQQLVVSVLCDVNDWSLSILGVGSCLADLVGNKGPQLINVDGWAPLGVSLQVEVSHTDLTEVTWMELIHQDSVMVLSTSVTATTWMVTVLSYRDKANVKR